MFLDSELEQKRLIKEGLHTLAKRITQDLDSQQASQKEQALYAIRDLLNQGGRYPKTAVQNILREQSVLTALLTTIKRISIIQQNDLSEEDSYLAQFLFPFCVECLVSLIDNNVRNKKEIVESDGILEVIVAEIGSRGNQAVCDNLLFILEGLLNLQDDEDVQRIKQLLLQASGIEVLLHYLQDITTLPQQTHIKEDDHKVCYQALSILKQLLGGRDKESAGVLIQFGGLQIVCRLLTGGPARPPNPNPPPIFSIGLAILEDVALAYMDAGRESKQPVLQELYQAGALAILLGFLGDEQHSQKSLFLLSELCFLDIVLEVLPVLLDTTHYQIMCSCAISDGGLQETGKWGCRVLAKLIDTNQQQSSLSVLRHLVMGRCVGALLKVGDTSVGLIQKACSSQGLSLLSSLGCGNPLETSIAVSQLLPFSPQSCAQILLRQNLLPPLVQEFVNELKILTCKKEEKGLQKIISVESQAHSSPLKQSSYDSLEDAGLLQLYPYRGDAKCSLVSVIACINSSIGQSSQLDSPLTCQISMSESTVMRSQISVTSSTQLSFGGLKEEVNVKRYDTVTFLVGGKEFYALGWVLEQQSPLIQHLLKSMKDVRDKITIPRVSGIPDEKMYQLFSNAVEFAYTGQAVVSSQNLLSLWALAKSLEMTQLADYCSIEMTEQTFMDDPHLAQAIFWLAGDKQLQQNSSRVFQLCMASVVERFDELLQSGLMAKIADENGDMLASGIMEQIRSKLELMYHY